MTDDKTRIDLARASPTKAFFVRMLTRDIELQDAILDCPPSAPLAQIWG